MSTTADNTLNNDWCKDAMMHVKTCMSELERLGLDIGPGAMRMDAQVLKQWESDRERLRAWCAESALFALKAFVRGDRKMGIRTTFQAVEYASRLSGETLSNVYMRDVLQFLKLECESHVG